MADKKRDRRGCPPGAGTRTGIVAPTGLPGGQIGNPPFIATQDQRERVQLYSKVMSQEMIAEALDISIDTLRRHFRHELQEGKREAVAAVGGKLLAKALAGHPASMIFYLKTQGKWSSRIELTGKDGGPIPTIDLAPFLKDMSDEQLLAALPIVSALLAAAGSPDLGGSIEDSGESDQGGASAPGA